MNIGNKIASLLGLHKNVNIQFMSYSGDCDTPPFFIKLDDETGLNKAYNKCSPVATIINRLASAMSNGKWWILDDSNNDVSGKYEAISNLLKKPNPLQIQSEFVSQMDVYRNLYGCVFVYAVIPEGYNQIEDATALWVVNPQRVDIKLSDDIYNKQSINEIIEKYTVTIDNKKIDVKPEHMLHIKDVYEDVGQLKSQIKGRSRLKSLEYEVKNIIQAQEAIYSLNKDRGAQGIITNKTKDVSGNIPLSPEEKKQIQDEYQAKYGLSHKQAKIIISDADLSWQQMSFNVKDLMLFEGIKSNIENISDAYNYPFELLANQKGTTFANKNEAKKFLYQDNIIPASKIYSEKFTSFFGLEKATIDIDFSDVECLKEAEKEKAESLRAKNQALQIAYKLGIITLEEYRIELDLDEKPKGNTFYTEKNVNNQGTETQSEETAGGTTV